MDAYLAASFSHPQIESELNARSSRFILAYQGHQLVGYIRLFESDVPQVVTGLKPVELVRIYVDPDLIGGGCGSALMARGLEEARRLEYETIWLGVWEKNQRAIQFYRKWGFEVVGGLDFVLGTDVQHDFLMARSLA
jgi:ribosomal protein S18 acetylase RimI-like enzyme